MNFLKGLLLRARLLFGKGAADRALDDEIRLHLEFETAKRVREGLEPGEARRQAVLAFGGVEATREAHRDGRGTRWIEELHGDARHAFRTLRRSPTLAATAIITLALGIGANVAIFSAVNAVILRPLPLGQPDRLVMLWEENIKRAWHQADVAPANYLDWKEQSGAFSDVAAFGDFPTRAALTGVGTPRMLESATVTGNFFSVLGVRPELGDGFTDAVTWSAGAPSPVAVISHTLWRDQFGSDPAVIGRTITLNSRAVQVVGVMPEGFAFPTPGVDVWRPTVWPENSRTLPSFRRAHWLRVIGRLKPGETFESANAKLQLVIKRLQLENPVLNAGMEGGLTPLQRFLSRDVRLPLLVLLAAVSMLLLIACANVGNLLLVQATGRRREMALRLALGARRSRLFRQALTESLVLSALGSLAGVLVGWWGTRALLALQPVGMLPVTRLGLDTTVLAYVLAVTTISGLLFGTAPALWAGRRAPADALKEGGRGGSGGMRARRWSNAMVIFEVALALLMTIGAGLLVRSFVRLQRVETGFDPNGVLAVSLVLPGATYDSVHKVTGFFDRLEQEARALPGIQGTGLVSQVPLTTPSWSSDFAVAGRAQGEINSDVLHRTISPDYPRVMRIPLLKGRLFTTEDRNDTPSVVIINESIAKKYFRGEDPVGQRIAFDRIPDSNSVWRTIVGVIGNEHQASLDVDARAEIFAPETQDTRAGMTLMLRTSGDPAAIAPAVRRVIASLDSNLAISTIATMRSVRDDSMARQRFLTTLLLVFSLVGVTLAAVGVYGVMAQLATQRTREMGIRMALGAQARSVQWLVIREGLRLTAFGVGLGVVTALVATRAMTNLLFGIVPADPVTFISIPAILAITAIMATWLPAAKASRADPVVTLRAE